MLTTVFLLVLIFALILGNAFLSITGPKRLVKASQGQEPEPMLEQQQGLGLQPERGAFEQMADRERTRMLSKRIDRLESLLLKINNAKFVAKKLNGTNIVQKMNDFDEFRQNTKLEIAALKQRLAASLAKNPKANKQVPNVDDARLHSLVYHNGG